MKRLATLLLFLLTMFQCLSQDTIYWSSEPLQWSNFMKRTGGAGFYKAFTYSGISFSLDEVNDSVVIKVTSYFDPKESWVHPDFLRESLLSHEQLHFDLTELYARKIRQGMQRYQGMYGVEFMKKNCGDAVRKIYMDLNNQLNTEQQRYDVETVHGTDTNAQLRWQSEIKKKLDGLVAFSH